MLVSHPPCLMHELHNPKDSLIIYKMSAPPSPLPSPPLPSCLEGAAVLSVAELTRCLDDVLHCEKCYETSEGLVKRREVLKHLNILVKQWIQSVSLTRGMHWSDIDKIGGRIVTYGSYMLGISHQGADIDALCIAPQHITRQEYFISLLSLLSYQAEVTELRAIEEAYVPVLKMRYRGIEIDMTFARLNVPEVPVDLEFLSDISLSNLDPKCIRSLNGYRSTQELLKLVPNIETFQMTLRAVKLWAKGQGLYSNSLGYLGGFSWSVLVAKTCMLNPNAQAAELVLKFFELFSQWRWPNPVALNEYENKPSAILLGPSSANGFLGGHQQIYSWNPEKNPQEKHQVMPIITPTFPHLNSTFNVTPSTLKLIQDKMTKAFSLTKRIFNGEETWDSLFQTHHIFDEYNHLLVVISTAKNYIQWFGLIESKIRHFLTSIEKDCYQTLHSARIWPKAFTKIGDTQSSITQQLWFVGLEFLPAVTEVTPEKIEFSRALKAFQETLYNQARSFYQEDMRINARYVRKTDLTGHLTDKEIQEIVSSQSQKREPTPPPPPSPPPPQAPCVLIGGESLQTSEGGGGGGQQQFFPADALSGNVLSSPSYAAAVTKSSSPSSSSSSSSCGGGSINNNYVTPNMVHKLPPPLLPNILSLSSLPPPSQAPLGPPPSHHRNFYGSPNGGANGASPSGGGSYHHHPNISHHHPTYHSNNHHYQMHGPPPHHLPGTVQHSRSPIMERTWNTQAAPNARKQGKGGGGGNHQQHPVSPSRPPQASSAGPALQQVPPVNCCNKLVSLGGSDNWSSSSSLGGIGTGHEFDLGAHGSGGESALDASYSSLESENGRSVSFSSDKFPPQALIQARIHHVDSKLSPSPPYNFYTSYDASIPPPSPISLSSPASSVGNGKGSISGGGSHQRHSSHNHSQRLSSSELRDVNTPMPIQRMQYQQLHFNFNPASIQHMQAAAASDSVFN